MADPALAHRRLAELVVRHGTEEEKSALASEMRLMWEMTTTFDGEWCPMEGVTLPGFLQHRARQTARSRHARAQRWSLSNQHGMLRTMGDEVRSAMAQMALVIMLGIPFDEVPKNHAAAKKNGNIGRGISAHIPKPGSYGLIVGEKEPANRQMFLIEESASADNTFLLRGWIRAGVAMKPGFQKTFTRDGVVSKPYVVPTEFLSSAEDWWREQGWRPRV